MKGDDAQLHYRGMAPQPYIQHHDKETRLDYKSKATHMPGFEVKTRMHMPWPGQGTHKKARLPQTAAEHSAPLHTKKVTKLCYERLRKLAKGTPLEGKLDHVLRYNERSGTYDHIPNMRYEDAEWTEMLQSDIDQLIRDDIVEFGSKEEVRHYGKLFPNFEEVKNRRRVIFWPKLVNSHLGYDSDFTLDGLAQQLAQLTGIAYASCYDLMCAYWQCALAKDVRNSFGFVGPDGRVYRFKVMAMGFGPSAEIMETIAKVLANAAAKDEPSVKVTTYIDNTRFGGPIHAAVVRVGEKYKKVVAWAGGTLNVEPVNKVHTRGPFLGVNYDYQRKLSSLTDRTVTKLAEARKTMSAEPSMEDLFSAFGILFFASQVLAYSLKDEYHAFKYYRRRAAQHAKGEHFGRDDPAAVWPSVRQGIDEWFKRLLKNVPARRTDRNNTATLFTDASLTGAGAVLFTADGRVITFAAVWNAKERTRRIEELEARAVTLAARHFHEELRGRHVDLWVDNTSVIGAMKKGYSKSYYLNRHVAVALRAIGRHFTVRYVPSKYNFADGPSRCPTASLPEGVDYFKYPSHKTSNTVGEELSVLERRERSILLRAK